VLGFPVVRTVAYQAQGPGFCLQHHDKGKQNSISRYYIIAINALGHDFLITNDIILI
jgi:homoserine acetyltransferase